MSARSDVNFFKDFGQGASELQKTPNMEKNAKKAPVHHIKRLYHNKNFYKRPNTSKDTSTIFDKLGKKQKKTIKYENVRVQYPVFQEMRKAQYALKLPSRSALIHVMYEFCKDAIYKTPDHKKRAKHFDKIMEAKEK